MNKAEFVTKMAELAEGTKTDAEKWSIAFLRTLEYAVENKLPIKLVGHLTMDIVPTKEKVGRNPQTGESVPIPAGHKVRIKPGKILKDLV